MTPQQLLRSLARVLPLLILSLAVPSTALSDPAAPGSSELMLEARAKLAQAAEDARLAPWQRDLMQSLARTGTLGALDHSAAGRGAEPPALAANSVDGAWNQSLGGVRSFHSAICDSVRDRMVVFGGANNGSLKDVWVLSLTDTTWTELTPTGTPPSARSLHSVIYDPVRDRMVVFGGHDGSSCLNDVWALSLSGAPAWTQLTPSGTAPSARDSHSAIYDSARDRMVVFGGGYYSPSLNDVWALSFSGTLAWTQLTPSGTPPRVRYGHSAIYDPVRDDMVVFGGYSSGAPGGPPRNDVCVLLLTDTTWTQLTPSDPPPSARYWHSAIYDPVRDRMVVFGGRDLLLSSLNDIWTLSLGVMPAWTQLTPSGTAPSGRYSHGAIYDPARDRTVIFGGYDGNSGHDDAWALSLPGTPSWTELSPGSPPIRCNHSAIYDPVRDRMVIFGGSSTDVYGDVWILSLAGRPVWTQLTPVGPPPSARCNHSAIYDPVRDRMMVFGGYSAAGYLNDVWALSLSGAPAWTQLTPFGTPPSARFGHTAIYDPVRDCMVMFGGSPGSYPYLNDVWALSLSGTPAWTQLTASGTPPSARYWHSAIYDPVHDRMVVFGGSGYTNDVWVLSLSGTPAWSRLTPLGTPSSGRYGHSALYDPVRDRMVVFGGKSSSSAFSDVWALSLGGTPAWTQLTPTGTLPIPRYLHGAIYDPVRDRMVVFGGRNNLGWTVNDSWALGWSTTVAVDDPATQPRVSGLRAPAPNPSRGTTAVSYVLAQAGRVRLGVYDVSGRLVRHLIDGERRAGSETVVWNGTDESGATAAVGVYFVRLAGPGIRETRKVTLLR